MASIQSSPDIHGQDFPPRPASPAPFELPESIVAQEIHQRAAPMGEIPTGSTPSTPNKAGGLMRRFSQNTRANARAAGQRLRRKTSSSGPTGREHSNGPITRRRSDSKTGGSITTSTTDLHNAEFDESLYMDSPRLSTLSDAFSVTSMSVEPMSPTRSSSEGMAPTLPDQLIRGSVLTKLTKKKKRKQLKFFLNLQGSKVSWHATKTSKSFFVDDIKNIRHGEDAFNYRQEHQIEEHDNECWFTILCADADRSKQTRFIHLIAPSEDDKLVWIETLNALLRHREDLMTGTRGSLGREHVIQAYWNNEMRKRSSHDKTACESGVLDLPAIEALCTSLHIHCSKKMIHEQFLLADSQETGKLNFDEFKDFLGRLTERRDLRAVFNNLTSGAMSGLTKERFLAFLENVQGIDFTSAPQAWDREFQKWVDLAHRKNQQHSTIINHSADVMDFDAFASFMVSDASKAYQLSLAKPTLDRPLNEYFISSSHNTYLSGRQVAGISSTENYITTLRHGCRCVELDCWNGSDGRPIVTHGHTGTSSVLFADCITVINRYAFEASPYPLILSLEVHCDSEQQTRMVQIMKEGFGDKLLVRPLAEHALELPSPEALRNRILVKVKRTEPLLGTESDLGVGAIGRQRSTSSATSSPMLPEVPSISSLPPLSAASTVGSSNPTPHVIQSPNQRSMAVTSASSAGEDSDTMHSNHALSDDPKKASSTSKIVSTLADLGVYVQAYKYCGFSTTEGREYNHIFSMSEPKANDLCKSQLGKAQLEEHNVRHLFRVYPGQRRITSTNFDPITFWRRGAQMAALNWQTYDRPMQIHQAMFAAGSDHFGYVLKPDYLRKERNLPSATEERVKLPRRLVRVAVEIISAQQLPLLSSMSRKANINPFIEVELIYAEDKSGGPAPASGGEDDSSRNTRSGHPNLDKGRSKVVLDNGYNPQFNERFELQVQTKYPDLVFVRWTVWSSPDGKYTGKNCTQLAVFTAKLDSLQQGYRHLPLYHTNGEEYIFSSLFCKIRKEEPMLVPSSVHNHQPGRKRFRLPLTRNHSADRGAEHSPLAVEQKKEVMKEIRERGEW